MRIAPGADVKGAIDKENGLRLGDFFGQVGSPLLARDDAHRGIGGKALLRPVGQPGAHAVIAAQGIAASEDEAADGIGVGGQHARKQPQILRLRRSRVSATGFA